MVSSFALFLALAWASSWLCLRGSCGIQPESAGASEAAGCGCGNPERTAVREKLEDGPTPGEPAVKYSRGANERDEKRAESQVNSRV